MKKGLYSVEMYGGLAELENGGSVLMAGKAGAVFAKLHPVKIKATPKAPEPEPEELPKPLEPLDFVRRVKGICQTWPNCISCPLLEWCRNLPPDVKPADWDIPQKEE